MVPPGEKEGESEGVAPSAEEKERYRQKLAEWRGMGFDVSSLEVLLETDFAQFKQRRFELLRNQILEGGAGPPPKHPAGAAGHPHHQPQPSRPSLFSHFAPLHGKGPAPGGTPAARPAQQAAPPPQSPAAQAAPAGAAAESSPPDHAHSEMRYPSVRRKRDRRVRTFSVTAEPAKDHVGVINIGGSGGRMTPAPARKRRAQAPVEEHAGVEIVRAVEEDGNLGGEGSTDEVETSTKEESPEAGPSDNGEQSSQEQADSGDGEETDEEQAASDGGKDQADEGEPEEPPEPGGPVPGKVVKKRKLAKKAPAPGRRAIVALAVVLVLIIAGAGAWYILAGTSSSITARDWHPASAMAGEDVTFNASNSSSLGSPITNYSWDFGDGGRDFFKVASHHYAGPGTYHVTLTVRNEKGDAASAKSVVTITPFIMTVPQVMVGDRGYYDAWGNIVLSNTDTYLYTLTLPPPLNTIHVSRLELNLTGTQNMWARDVVNREDGFKNVHRALQADSDEKLTFSGKAFTDGGDYPINGALKYNESSYADPASGGVFLVDSYAYTTISLPLARGSNNSSDTLRTYPSVAGVSGQFRLEKIYSGHKFDQSDPATLNGTITGGGVLYTWNCTGVDNAGGRASMGIHVTADPAALRSSGISEFYVDMFVSGASSMPTMTHVHVVGLNGDTTYISDHYTSMTGHSAGSVPVDRAPQQFNADPLPAGMFSPFNDVPAAGTGPTSLEFTPEEAEAEARSKSPEFAGYLAANPQAYAVRGKYFEGPVPGTACWNLSFAYPGAGTGRYINVSRDILHQYSVSSSWETPAKVSTSESALGRLLTLASAQAIFQNDSATQASFFAGGTVQYQTGATLSLQADGSYPAINLASMSASAQGARYIATLQKGDNTSALSMDSGQMLYFWTHKVT